MNGAPGVPNMVFAKGPDLQSWSDEESWKHEQTGVREQKNFAW